MQEQQFKEQKRYRSSLSRCGSSERRPKNERRRSANQRGRIRMWTVYIVCQTIVQCVQCMMERIQSWSYSLSLCKLNCFCFHIVHMHICIYCYVHMNAYLVGMTYCNDGLVSLPCGRNELSRSSEPRRSTMNPS